MDGDRITQNSVDGDTAGGDPKVFTIPEAAARLRMGKSTVWDLVAKNKIESFKIGRLRRIRPEALERYIEQQAARDQHEAVA